VEHEAQLFPPRCKVTGRAALHGERFFGFAGVLEKGLGGSQ
jgi:hypothetical protein